VIPPATYTAADDAVLATWGRDTVGPAGAIGTCAVRPRELGGVVDPDLNVYAVDALKICDLSIAPEHGEYAALSWRSQTNASIVSSNLTSLAMAVAERGVVKMGEYLGIDETDFT
jgi:alcohol oxidase